MNNRIDIDKAPAKKNGGHPKKAAKTIFTEEKKEQLLDKLFSPEEIFRGKVADLKKVSRFNILKAGASWLFENCPNVEEILLDEISNDKRSAIISIGLAPVLPLTGKDLIAFRGMLENADSILLNGLDDGTIRVAFTTEHVWRA